MSDDYKTWWEIPSIVHFCEAFSPCCEDICPININEFELAVKDNSSLLTDMALRFMKTYGFYDPNTNVWWTKMKEIFQEKCNEYKFEYPLDSVINFDGLSPKRKVEALYIMCHIVLDVEIVQYKISNKPELWHKFNVKPLGYDLNNSVYWYFGTTRLYREDFENSLDLSVNSSVSHNITQQQHSELNSSDSSKIVFLQNHHTQPYPSGILGLGKWNIICDDDKDGWYSFADDTKYSKNAIIKSLHHSVCNIIKNLPLIENINYRYKYSKFCLRNRSLPLDKPKDNTNLGVQTRSALRSKNVYGDKTSSVKRFCNGTTKLPLSNINRIGLCSGANDNTNHPDLLKSCIKLKYETRVSLIRHDQENNELFINLQPTMR